MRSDSWPSMFHPLFLPVNIVLGSVNVVINECLYYSVMKAGRCF